MDIHTVDALHDSYMSNWKPSRDIPDLPCTAKHTIFTANIVAGIMLSQAFNVLHKRSYHSYIWKSLAPYMSKEEGLVLPINMEKTSDKETETQTSVSESESTPVVWSTKSR